MLFIGGFAAYNDICAEVADAGYKGFSLAKILTAAAIRTRIMESDCDAE